MKDNDVRTGRWLWVNNKGTSNIGVMSFEFRIQCSACCEIIGDMYGILDSNVERMYYCPHCGAYMWGIKG